MKKLILTSPFRHNLYLNDDFFYVNRGVFNQAITSLDRQIPELDISSAWLNKDKIIQSEKYTSVKYDSLNLDSKPVLVIDFTDELGKFITKQSDFDLPKKFSPADCHVKIYNNTIGLISLTLTFDCLDDEVEQDPSRLDLMTTGLAEYVEEYFLRSQVESVLACLQDSFKTICSHSDIRMIYQDHVFDRVLDILKNERYKVLWTGRLLYVPDEEKCKWLKFFEEWASTEVVSANNTAFFRQGNSLVLQSYINEEEIIACFDLCQYYFAIFSIANTVMKRVAGSFGRDKNKLKQQLEICQEINLQVKSISVNEQEAISGLQGKRRQTVKEIFACWEYDSYVDMVISRNEILQSKIHNYQQANNQRYGKIIEFALTFVGSIALADFLLNIVMYINPDYSELKGYGVLFLLSKLPGELIVSGVIFLAILFSIIFALRNK